MTELVPITKEGFKDKYWVNNTDYSFTRNDSCCDIVIAELPTAMKSLPTGFILNEDKYVPVVLQSFQQGRNLLVNEDGRWLGRYIPAGYRSYPFALANNSEDNSKILCIRENSDVISGEPGMAFFDDTGEASNEISEVLNFLSQLLEQKAHTERFCELISSLGVLIPWDITLKQGDHTSRVEGLYRVDEEKLLKLSDEDFGSLRKSGMLQYVYAHLFSVLNLQDLANFGSMLDKDKSDLDEISFSGIDDSGTLNFENF